VVRGRLRGESGQALILTALTMLVLLGIAGFAIDAGRAWFTQRELQRALDAAALAAAQDLPDVTAAQQTAHLYGPETGSKNPLRIADSVTLSVDPRCVTSIPGSCQPYNALQISGTATLSTTFAKVLGFDTLTVRAKATACSPCLNRKKLDIMVVLDRTGSMCQFSNGGSDPNCTDLTNARGGIEEFLDVMDPSVHHVGLAVLPPKLPSATCSARPQQSWYDNVDSQYLLAPLSTDYKLANGSLNASSTLVDRLRNCTPGGGRTAYANAIDVAQTHLQNAGRSDAENIIVFLSDGAANYGPNYYPNTSPYRSTPCRQGVNSSGVAKTAGTTVYSIGYDLNGSGTDFEQCHVAWWTGGATTLLEQPPITSWDAIRAIATDQSTFYNKPDPGDLRPIFQAIAADIGARFSRLIDDDAQ
jgi:hypothetical protein